MLHSHDGSTSLPTTGGGGSQSQWDGHQPSDELRLDRMGREAITNYTIPDLSFIIHNNLIRCLCSSGDDDDDDDPRHVICSVYEISAYRALRNLLLCWPHINNNKPIDCFDWSSPQRYKPYQGGDDGCLSGCVRIGYLATLRWCTWSQMMIQCPNHSQLHKRTLNYLFIAGYAADKNSDAHFHNLLICTSTRPLKTRFSLADGRQH